MTHRRRFTLTGAAAGPDIEVVTLARAWSPSPAWRPVAALVAVVGALCLHWSGHGTLLLWLAAAGVLAVALGTLAAARSAAARLTALAFAGSVVGELWLVYEGPAPFVLWLCLIGLTAASVALSIRSRASGPLLAGALLLLVGLQSTFAAFLLQFWTGWTLF
jgi:hypothetical protein